MHQHSILSGACRFLAVVCLLATAAANAERPKIGLVLGGGGARGAAHIGVLQELERQRVPIDAIAGTSMGAIVGGLYAIGKTPEELEELVTTLDWVASMRDTPSREHLSFRRKLDDEHYPITAELGVSRQGVELPMGAVEGQRLSLLLRELTIDVSHIDDFDDLPIPFRAIATNVETGDAHVLREGDLAQAIRASMSVPAVFAPAEIDGHLFVDGGIASNLPIDVMRSMDVDIIIAVDVEFPLYPADELDSAVRITEQMITILMRRETLRQIEHLGDDDILIRPALGTFDSGAFERTPETIEPGRQAALAVAGRLGELALDEAAFAEHLARRDDPPPIATELAFVRVEDDGPVSARMLESHLDVSPGDRVDAAQLSSAAQDLYGLNLHEQVSYRLVEEDGATGVVFNARSKSYGPNILKFAVSLENDFEGSSSFNIGTRLRRIGINSQGAEWQTDLQLGTDPHLISEFYQPFRAGSPPFVAPRIDLRQRNLNTFDGEDAIARYRISESTAFLDLGAEIGSVGEFRIGAYRGFGNARVKVGAPTLPNIDFDTGGVLARLRFDTQDNAQFPRSGVRADLRWNVSLPGLGADARYDTIEAEFENTWSRGKNSFEFGALYATTLDSQDAIQDLFTLGGFLRLSGLERAEISGPHAALARLVYYRRVSDSTGGLLNVPIYLGASLETGNTWSDRGDISFSSALVNGGLFAGFDTPIGPVYTGVGFAEGGRSNYYLFFGAPRRW
ncbi:MAG: patatin-like phospholipase family protein [Woeseiaceae bacterium]|nr:patatin-like phospholipase family protein [Woeseiaceae bacterium]